jgi:hypothetical protein
MALVTTPRRGLAVWLAGALLALLALALPAAAKEMEAADKTALASAIDNFNGLMRKGDFTAVVEASVPDAIIRQIAASHGIKEADIGMLKTVIREQMASALNTVKLIDFGMDQNAISYRELPDGSSYAMVPTMTVMQMGEQKFRARSDTLALKDGGRWYLLRVTSGEQADIVKAAYPQFKDVQFSDGTMEEIGK